VNRAERRRRARDGRQRGRDHSPSRDGRRSTPHVRVDPAWFRQAAKAHFVITEAERFGVEFSIENGALAITYPLAIDQRFWRQLQAAINDNRQVIANYVLTRSLGLLS
jgi:hypothetical protein